MVAQMRLEAKNMIVCRPKTTKNKNIKKINQFENKKMHQKFLNNLHSDKEMWSRFSDILTSDIKFSSSDFIKNSKKMK